MATEKQTLANRLNAQRSTGPKTTKGKAIASQNATKHGLLARKTVINSENQADFDRHQEQMLAELEPVGPMESILAMRIVNLSWRLARADNFQALAFNALNLKTTSSPIAKQKRFLDGQAQPDPELDLGRTIARDFASPRVLDRLLTYERRIEHSLYKTILEIQKLIIIRNMAKTNNNNHENS